MISVDFEHLQKEISKLLNLDEKHIKIVCCSNNNIVIEFINVGLYYERFNNIVNYFKITYGLNMFYVFPMKDNLRIDFHN